MRRPAWLGGPGKDADGAVLLTGPGAGELLKTAVEHAGGDLIDWHLDHVDTNPGQSRRRPIRLGCSGLRESDRSCSA